MELNTKDKGDQKPCADTNRKMTPYKPMNKDELDEKPSAGFGWYGKS